MSFKSKFLPVLESYMNRYTSGGFLTGDVVFFVKGYDKKDSFKSLEPGVQQKIKDMIASGDLLRVSAVKNRFPSFQPANADVTPYSEPVIDITSEIAPGRYLGFVTVPGDLLTVDQGDGINRTKVPAKNWRKSEDAEDGQPKEAEYDKNSETFKQTRMAYQGNNLSPSQVEMAKESVEEVRLASQYLF